MGTLLVGDKDLAVSSQRQLLTLMFGRQPFFGGATRGHQSGTQANLLLGALVALVGRRGRPVRILEVGSWVGFTALTFAYAAANLSDESGQVLCVDRWEPYFGEADASDEHYAAMDRIARSGLAHDLFLHNVATGPKNVSIETLRGSSSAILPTLTAGSFDLVYLDGSHYYEDVRHDILNAMPLVRDGGVLCGDDLNLELADVDEAMVRANLSRDGFHEPAGGRFLHPGVTLAVAETFGRVSYTAPTWYMRKVGPRFERIVAQLKATPIPPHFPPEMKEHAESLFKKT
jgi:predicted O-methyltransferase YrrM